MKSAAKGLVVLLTTLFVLGFIYSAAFAFPGVSQETNACGQKMTAEMKAQRALDIAEITNVAGMHEYYHSALMHKAELENVWSTKDDISWKNNNDYYANKKDVYKFYADGCPQGEQKRGSLWYHMLTSPVIVVAGDGQTAQAVWQSFGNVTGKGGQLQWTEEKYAMDFIKEDGKWKIWHLRTYVEFYTDASSTNTNLWASKNMAAPEGASNAMSMGGGGGAPPSGGQGGQGGAGAPPGGGQGGAQKASKDDGATIKAEPGVSFDNMKPTEKGNYYEGYSENYMPVFKPVPPQSYCTWKDTKDYNKQD
jgi:hypothetical protein